MPAVIRRRLRDRCKAPPMLNIYMPHGSMSGGSDHDDDVSHDGYSFQQPQPSSRLPPLTPFDQTFSIGLNPFHRLIPYIYLALHPGRHLPAGMITSEGSPFTHIIKVTYAAPQEPAGNSIVHVDHRNGYHAIDLTVPVTSRFTGGRWTRRWTALSREQLAHACDFMMLALPYRPGPRTPPTSPVAARNAVRLIVMATDDEDGVAAVDVMSIILCYLSLVSTKGIPFVIQCVVDDMSVPMFWKEAIPLNQIPLLGEATKATDEIGILSM